MSADSPNIIYDAEKLKLDTQLTEILKKVDRTTFNGSQIIKVGKSNCRISKISSLGMWEFVFYKEKSNSESDAIKTISISIDDVDEVFGEDDNGVLRL